MAAFEFRDIEFREVHPGSPEEAWGQDRSRVTTTYLVNWEDRRAAEVALLGKVAVSQTSFGGNDYGFLMRTTPHPYPNVPWLYATSVPRVDGVAPRGKGDDGVAIFEDAKLTVIYEALTYEIREDAVMRNPDIGDVPDEALLARYVTITSEEQFSSISYRAGTWKWLEGPNGPPANREVTREVQAFIPRTMRHYVWHQVPIYAAPQATIRGMVGKVNSVEFDGADAGTLLLYPPQWEPTRMPDGTRAFNIRLRMCEDTSGWNRFPDPTDLNRRHLIGVGDQRPYQSADFLACFRPTLVG